MSRSDGDQQESNSIKNQRALLNDYMGKHPELHKFDEYVDDGYSGTNFERPDFKRMICQREGLHQVDLLSPAADKITQQEYHAQRRGQLNLDIANGISELHTPHVPFPAHRFRSVQPDPYPCRFSRVLPLPRWEPEQ